MFSETTNLLMQFFSIAKKVEGRIKLQKVIYILQTKGAINFELDYKYALYGPYSADLQLEVDYLVDIGFLKETASNAYSYEINNDFEISLEVEDKTMDTKPLIQNLLDKESPLLEVTSTIYYLKSYDYYKERSSLEQKLKLLKPNLEDRINDAFALYSSLESSN